LHHCKKGVKKYETKLQEAINNVIDVDIPAVENIEFASRHKLKKLLAVLSTLVPYTPNIKALQNCYISYTNKTIGDLTKPDKVLLNNKNLSYIFGENAHIGSARETFFVNQLNAVSHVSLAHQGDFVVEKKNKIPLWLFGMLY